MFIQKSTRQYTKRGDPQQRRRGGEHHERKKVKFNVTNRLEEVNVGITEFIGDHDHFTGIVKERYHDFYVCEINDNGEIAKLTTQEMPPVEEIEIDPKTCGSKEMLEKINTFLEMDSEKKSIELDVTELTKNQRRAIHALVNPHRSTYSQTVEKNDKKLMIVSRGIPIKGGSRYVPRGSRYSWAEGYYCEFILHKVNIDTMNALNELAIHMRVKSNAFNYAGTKDRRACTSQWVSLRRVDPQRIQSAAKKIRGVFVGNFRFVDKKLELGSLKGNRFTIALRNVTAPDEEICKAMTSLRDNGFINYYGLQRFGTVADIPTHEIGKALLQGRWEEAIDLILKPRDGDKHYLARAREKYATTKNARAALRKLHHCDHIEAKLLTGINKNGTNLQGALDFLPRNTRLMYIHAYQSFVWNNIVSRRFKEYGRKPIVGDLVYETSNTEKVIETLDYSLPHEDKKEDELTDPVVEKKCEDKFDKNERDQVKEGEDQIKENSISDVKKIELDTVNDDNDCETKKETEVTEPTKDSNEKDNDLENDKNRNEPIETINLENTKKDDSVLEKESLNPLPNVKILTEEDLPHYTLADVVMPQPGWRVVYPPYAKAWYEEFLANDGLNIELKQKNKKYSLSGAYRKILEIPEDLSWRVMHYQNLHDDLILGDINELRGNPAPEDCIDGKYKALILEMSLKPSCYATMGLREVLKHDTSAKIQAAQSAAYHAEDEAKNKEENSSEPSKDNEVQMEVAAKEIKDLPMEEESNKTVSGTSM